MKHAMMKIKEKVFMIMEVAVILVFLIIITYFSHEQYVGKIPEIEENANDRKEAYIKFEELYENMETELNEVVEELKNEALYEPNGVMYVINFEEEAIKHKEDPEIILCYFDGNKLSGKEDTKKELISLNKNESLKNSLKKIGEKGIVRGIIIIDLMKDVRSISFEIDTKYTPFVKDNNGIINSIVYCEDEECQKYGYYKIRNNWYLRIPPRPE